MSNQKHIVILTYNYPPHNHVGGRRVYYFSKYLTQLGYRVSVITANETIKPERIWDTDISFVNLIKLNKIKIPNNYSATLKFIARIYWYLTAKKSSFSKRLAWKIGNVFLPHDFNIRLNFDTNNIIQQTKNIDYIIATGGPWSMLEYGVLLKSITNAKLILDYRDPWNDVSGVGLKALTNHGLFHQYIKKKLLKKEQQILKKSDLVISVSQPIIDNLKQIYPNIKTQLIENGFDKTEFNIEPLATDYFEILYFGNIRDEQNIELLLNSLKKINNRDIKLNLIGTKIANQKIIKTINKYKSVVNIHITDFASKKTVAEYINKASILVHFSYGNIKGIPSSKLYQYISLNKPILLISNTNDIMEDIITKTNTGTICKNNEEIEQYILTNYELWKNKEEISYKPNINLVNSYSYKNQTDLIQKSLNEL